MSRKIYNRLSFIAVSWLDESTLAKLSEMVGRRLRVVFGVSAAREGRSGHTLPTNLTVIVEGAQRLYTTRGEDHCTVDTLSQQRLRATGTPRRYRIVARGFCVAPASTLNDAERILVESFDFAGNAVFGDDAIR